MKRFLMIVVLGLLWCNVGFADDKKELKAFKDYSYDLNDNIINYGWKVKSVRNTSTHDIYILNKNSWIQYCTVEIVSLRSKCNIP